MRVRIKESSFCLSAFKGNAREFPDGGGKVDAGPCPDNLLGRRVIGIREPIFEVATTT